MYNDFLGEVIAEETRTGTRRPANKNNPITKRRKLLEHQIKNQARELGKDPAEVALEYVVQSSADLQRYVASKGEQPLNHPAELATQAYLIRMKDVKDTQRILGVDEDEANAFLDEAEANAAAANSSEADNFIGPLLAAISPVASQGAAKIAAKRKAKGKKAGFWETLAGGAQPQQTQTEFMPDGQGGGFFGGVKVFANDVISRIKEQEKRKEINKMLPVIIGGVVVLILVTVLIARNARN